MFFGRFLFNPIKNSGNRIGKKTTGLSIRPAIPAPLVAYLLTFLLFLAEITNLKKQVSNKSQNQKIKLIICRLLNTVLNLNISDFDIICYFSFVICNFWFFRKHSDVPSPVERYTISLSK